jgi:hypothetical protein
MPAPILIIKLFYANAWADKVILTGPLLGCRHTWKLVTEVNEATGFNSSEMPMLRIPFGLKMTSVNAKNNQFCDVRYSYCLLACVRNSPLMTGKTSRRNINISFLSSNNSIRVCSDVSTQAHAVQFEITTTHQLMCWLLTFSFSFHHSKICWISCISDFPQFVFKATAPKQTNVFTVLNY